MIKEVINLRTEIVKGFIGEKSADITEGMEEKLGSNWHEKYEITGANPVKTLKPGVCLFRVALKEK